MSIPLSRLSDEELIAEAQNDNEVAFNLLVGRYKDPLMNFVFRFVGDLDDCEDIVQETFIRVYRSRKSYRPVAKFSTWAYTIATNLAKSHLRRKKLRKIITFSRSRDEPEPMYDLPDENARTDAMVESSFREERIQRALDTLPVKYREIVVMRDVQELTYEEIVAITRMPMGTVKSRINRARALLQEMLKDLWSE
jgi:RNA polymerase sigma-70 factor (ECF subfamily)